MKKLAVVALMALLALTTGCRSSKPDQYVRAAQLLLRDESQTGVQEIWEVWGSNIAWDAGLDVVGEVDDSRMPDWAQGQYTTCIHWHETFTYTHINSNRQPGQPLEETLSGGADGWILLAKDLSWHILQLDLEYGGESGTWIDDWGPPDSA